MVFHFGNFIFRFELNDERARKNSPSEPNKIYVNTQRTSISHAFLRYALSSRIDDSADLEKTLQLETLLLSSMALKHSESL